MATPRFRGLCACGQAKSTQAEIIDEPAWSVAQRLCSFGALIWRRHGATMTAKTMGGRRMRRRLTSGLARGIPSNGPARFAKPDRQAGATCCTSSANVNNCRRERERERNRKKPGAHYPANFLPSPLHQAERTSTRRQQAASDWRWPQSFVVNCWTTCKKLAIEWSADCFRPWVTLEQMTHRHSTRCHFFLLLAVRWIN